MKWKLAKWWLVGLLALLWALWVGSGYMPVQASPTNQDTFKIGGDLIIAESQTVNDAFAIGIWLKCIWSTFPLPLLLLLL